MARPSTVGSVESLLGSFHLFFPSAVITPRDDKWTARHRCSFVRFVTPLCVLPTDEFLSGICNNRSDVSSGKRRNTVSVFEARLTYCSRAMDIVIGLSSIGRMAWDTLVAQ